MSPQENTAFASLENRVAAEGSSAPLDRISLRDHVVEVEIGAFQVERGSLQRVAFDVVVEVSLPKGPLSDDVDKILSYDTITNAIAFELAAERLNLLETLAERICDRILTEPPAQRVFLRIQKLDRGVGDLGVEVVRARATDAPSSNMVEDVPKAVLVYLSDGAVSSALLSGWLDQLEQTGKPVILCVGRGRGDRPVSTSGAAQRRIDLLEIEQNAWVLAGLDSRCIVVASRTELDWNAHQGNLVVWAPSKIVLDTLDFPKEIEMRGVDLANWFAGLINPELVVLVGDVAEAMPGGPAIVVPLDQKQLFDTTDTL